MLAKVMSCAVVGLEGAIVEVEVDISPGLPTILIARAAFQYNLKRCPHMLLMASVDRTEHPSVHDGYCFLII